MKIIIISTQSGTKNHWHVSRMGWVVLGLALLIFVTMSSMVSYWFATAKMESDFQNASRALQLLQMEDAGGSPREMDTTYYAQRLGGLQAEAIRIQTLLTQLADQVGMEIDDSLYAEPMIFGGYSDEGELLSELDFQNSMEQLQLSFSHQNQFVSTLQKMAITDGNIRDTIPTGRPVEDGWISSSYGYRVDPFSGKKVFHRGFDFAGKEGSNVIAVADGIVTWAGTRGNYGKMLEIDHGNGYTSRYGHNKALEVKVGERINAGQTIALMGSTGRSTGPHVHFEILLAGKPVNPYKFVKK